MATWTAYVEYDLDAQVWYVRASDMPGLHLDAATVDELARKAAEHLADLVEINANLVPGDQREPPHSVRIVAHHERVLPVAV